MSNPKTFNRKPLCIVVSSPSGAGKTTLVQNLVASLDGVKKTISHTTRKPRPSEVPDTDYHFVSDEAFASLKDRGALVEHARVYDHWYGTSHQTVQDIMDQGKDPVLVIEQEGARNVKAHFPHVVCVLIVPPSLSVLRDRLEKREKGKSDDIEDRLSKARQELLGMGWYDFVIINDDMEQASAELIEIIRASQKRMDLLIDWEAQWAKA